MLTTIDIQSPGDAQNCMAWRIMLLTLMGRQVPELPPVVLFSYIEIEVNYLTKYEISSRLFILS